MFFASIRYNGSMEKKGNGPVVIPCGSDENSSFMKGAARGPEKIREALFSRSMNWFTEGGRHLDFSTGIPWGKDPGATGRGDAWRRIRTEVGKWRRRGYRPVVLGGDHAVTHPVLQALVGKGPPLDILHFDAHPDLYHDFENNPRSHGSPFARIMEEGLCRRLVQVGIRAADVHQREQAEKFLVETIEMRNLTPDLRLSFDGLLYISVDLDVLEPGLAPGVSHFEPGGMTVREVIGIIQRVETAGIAGADIVEYNPARDVRQLTAYVAAKLLKEILDRMIQVNGD